MTLRIPKLGNLKRNITIQWGGQSKHGRRGAMLQSQPGQPRLLSRAVEKYWSLDTFQEDKKGKEKRKLPKSESLNGREVVRLLTGMERKRMLRRQLSQSAVQGSAASHYCLHERGGLGSVCHPTAFHQPQSKSYILKYVVALV